MSYLALYRKYRPEDFEDFAGQDDITKSLRYQVKTKTFGHSYIFSGIRGTGKTSMAKVFAKAVNCLDPQEGNPCGVCTSCVNSMKGLSLDVVEMDAASNNGVDDIRELRESARFLPADSNYKVYIIDEVQMLSNSAFNALLKTLEEPGESVIFILATTELHKIPETILSRCMRYNFKRIEREAMVSRLAHICKMEGVSYETEALELIGEQGGGALRDAITLLDKALTMARGNLTVESVQDSLGLLGRDRTHELLSCLYKGKLDASISVLGDILREGKEISMIFTEILSFMRGILLSRMMDDKALISYLGFSMEKYKDHYRHLKDEEILYSLEVFDSASRKLRLSNLPRLTLEMALVEIASSRPIKTQVEVQQVFEKRKIERIEEELPPAGDVDFSDIQYYWERLLDRLKEKNHVITAAYLSEALVEGIDSDNIYLSFLPQFKIHRDSLMKRDKTDDLEPVIEEVFGKKMRLQAYIKGEEEPLLPKTEKKQEEAKIEEVIVEEKEVLLEEKIEEAQVIDEAPLPDEVVFQEDTRVEVKVDQKVQAKEEPEEIEEESLADKLKRLLGEDSEKLEIK